MKGTLINVCAPVAELIEGHSSELKLYEISCRFFKVLLLRCHLPIGALPFSRFLLGTGIQLAANRFGRSIPPSKPCCIGGAEYVIGSDP
jgi:hypothetical protein